MSARETKNGFGLMIDTARAEPIHTEKHGRGGVADFYSVAPVPVDDVDKLILD